MQFLRLYLTFFLCNLLPVLTYSQTIPQLNISYGESINLGKVDEKMEFRVTSPQQTTEVIIGSKINSFLFNTPGLYLIQIKSSPSHDAHQTHDENCAHNLYPEKIQVNVASWRIVFDESSIQFSERIVPDKAVSGCFLSVNTQVETYTGEPFQIKDLQLNIVGVGVEISGSLQENIKLSSGANKLRFALQGKATLNAYVALDFILPDGRVKSVSLPNPIFNLP